MKWNESKHPRDKDGKFTDSGINRADAMKMTTNELRVSLAQKQNARHYELVLIPPDFFGAKSTHGKSSNQNIEIPAPPIEAFEFADLYTNHHIAHANEMGYKNQKEYERAAIEFWNKGDGTIYYSKARNSFYKYNENTCEMVVVSSDGTIHTFMKYSKNKFSALKKWDIIEVYDKI